MVSFFGRDSKFFKLSRRYSQDSNLIAAVSRSEKYASSGERSARETRKKTSRFCPPTTDPYARNYGIRLLHWVCDAKRSSG